MCANQRSTKESRIDKPVEDLTKGELALANFKETAWFYGILRKFWQSVGLAPPTGNPGPATELFIIKTYLTLEIYYDNIIAFDKPVKYER